MLITKNTNDNELTLAPEGRIDSATAPEFEKELFDSVEGITSLVLDLKGLSYISSAGLRVLLSAQKRMNKQGKMKLINVNEQVNEVLEITGFSEILTIE
ncbi:MAG: STAS domain-containing protein [Clostridia bacterium]|nr:STAS domain-containing protein [Clostridia bacterium]